ncbi:MAG: hypothetical protein JW809_05595 [Pirellulales bacterium]|nr:hypothetical protein [Pirellulales bacterium]
MHHAVRRVCLLTALVWPCLAGVAPAQQMRFPTPVPADALPSSAPPSTFQSPSALQAPSAWQSPGTLPSVGAASPLPGSGTGLGSGASTPGLVPVTPGSVAGPSATYPTQGALAPPPSSWDPYAPPSAMQSPTLLPSDYQPSLPEWAMPSKMQRFLDELRLDYHYLAARGSKRFGTNDLDLSASFALPMFYNPETPVLVTPGFAFHWWDGPTQGAAPIPGILGHLPPRVYDAYLDTVWNPSIYRWLGGELGFRIGVYSDFREVNSHSLRYMGHGLFVLALSEQGNVKLKGGIVYLDRVRIKMLPAGGVAWRTGDVQFDLIFPYPRVAWRRPSFGNIDWWVYARGEYGGGSWTAKPDKAPGSLDQIDYNDLRASLGLEFNRASRLSGFSEVGVAFDRELLVRGTREKFSPSTTIFLRAGLVY